MAKTNIPNARQNNLALQEVNERIQTETLTVFEKARFKEYLETVSTFPTYSANNQLLIHQQQKDATMVCGYSAWKKKGRHVLKGSKGIKILAPNTKTVEVEKKDANGNTVYDSFGVPVMEKKKELIGFSVATVFDVTQTAGKPIPSISALLHGKVDGYPEIIDILKKVSPVPISEGEGLSEVGRIVITSGLSEQQTIRFLLPEIAGAVITKSKGEDVSADSLEAESCAHVIAKHFGIDADYDFDYLSDWSSGKTLEELTESLNTIQKTSIRLIEDIERCAEAKYAL